nr:MAG TPA: hypothetical protein [Caudoviricetes sp.]
MLFFVVYCVTAYTSVLSFTSYILYSHTTILTYISV